MILPHCRAPCRLPEGTKGATGFESEPSETLCGSVPGGGAGGSRDGAGWARGRTFAGQILPGLVALRKEIG